MAEPALNFPPRIEPVPFAAVQVPVMSDAELDALPFGVICLSPEGKVLRYNLAEARLARLDRAQVIGKNFFTRVAPCTATPEFEGRVRSFFKGTNLIDHFSYLFDFKFGAQKVEIELIRVSTNDRVYLLVNRKSFDAPREGLPAGFAAPLQNELAPREPELGVIRDASARRSVLVPASFFTALQQTWRKVAPKAWRGFTREWGWQWGKHAVVDLEADLLEHSNQTLRELPMRSAMERVAGWAQERGLGTLRFDFSPSKHGVFGVTFDRCAIGEAVAISEAPSCGLVEGLLEAVCEHLSQKLLAVREVRCCAQGFEACSFVVAAEKRAPLVEKAIAGGAESLEAVVEALRARP